jgi:hypothetical protein
MQGFHVTDPTSAQAILSTGTPAHEAGRGTWLYLDAESARLFQERGHVGPGAVMLTADITGLSVTHVPEERWGRRHRSIVIRQAITPDRFKEAI